MPVIKDLLESLDKIAKLHRKKNDDYAIGNNPFSNFDFTVPILNSFSSDRDKVYIWPIAIKIARLGVLLSSNRPPNNESVEDSLLDIATYVLIWKADIVRRGEELGKTRQVDTMEGIFPSNEFFDLIKIMPDSQIDELLAFIRQLREARSLGREGRPLQNVEQGEPGNAYPDNQQDVPTNIKSDNPNEGWNQSIEYNDADDNKKDSPDHSTHVTSAPRLRNDLGGRERSKGYKSDLPSLSHRDPPRK